MEGGDKVKKGWISLHRRIKDHWLFPSNESRVFTKFESWIDLLLMVNYESRQIMFNNTVIDVDVGEKITSIKSLSDRWKWSRKKVSNFLDLLEKQGQIIQERTPRYTVINIVNFEDYQQLLHNDSESHPKEHLKNHQRQGVDDCFSEKGVNRRTAKEHLKSGHNDGGGEKGLQLKREKGTSKVTPENTDVTTFAGGFGKKGDVKGTTETEERNIKRTSKEHPRNTKNNSNNDNNINNNNVVKSKYNFSDEHMKLAKLLFKFMRSNNPNAKEPNFKDWANTFRLMMERDKRTGKDIQDVILWSQNDQFWHTNILSARKLREQYDRLFLQMSNDKRFKVINGGRLDGEHREGYGKHGSGIDFAEYDFSNNNNV